MKQMRHCVYICRFMSLKELLDDRSLKHSLTIFSDQKNNQPESDWLFLSVQWYYTTNGIKHFTFRL